MGPEPVGRSITSAELLAVGTELTTGETRDTNSGDLARELTGLGVEIGRIVALPDDLGVVTDAFRAALSRSDLVLSTGGLGPTPDDLTREAIAAALGETAVVDPDIEVWLRDLFERRGLPMSKHNRKQAWVLPGGSALPNPNGTAPGWWVERDGRVIVALPGPPREMRPMWEAEVLPRLRERGLGADWASRTLRLTGIGESALADLIGEEALRRPNPVIATYARADAVDVRVSAVGTVDASADELVASALRLLDVELADFVFGHGEETWADALGLRLAGRTLASVEVGTGGSLAALLGNAPFLALAEVAGRVSAGQPRDEGQTLAGEAERIRARAGASVGLAVGAAERGGDTAVTIAISDGQTTTTAERTCFPGGPDGRRRAALVACAELWRWLAPD